MTADIVNLRRAKLSRAREIEAEQAAQSRARHGRTKAQRDTDTEAAKESGRVLDHARIDASDQP